MNSHDDQRGINKAPVDNAQQGNNASPSVQNSSSTSTIKIDSLCIKLGIVKDKGDAAAADKKCSHFSIRGYVSGMREKGSRNLLLPSAEELPPMEVPQFRYWLCQSCLQNCGNHESSNTTPPVLLSVRDQSMIRLCARSFRPQLPVVLPFGEGTSGLKPVDNTIDDEDDDESVVPALGVKKSQPCQEISADCAAAVPPQEPITFCSSATNFASKANIAGTIICRKESNVVGVEDYEDPLQDIGAVKDAIAGIVGPTNQSSQQNDHPRRKTRKVRLLKELLGGNNEIIQQRKKENSAVICSDPEPSSPSPAAASMIKRKVQQPQPHDQNQNQDQDHDQRSVDHITTTHGTAFKKAKTFKGNYAAAKTTMVHEHSKDPGVSTENDKKYLWNKIGTHRNSIADNVSSDPVTAWRSIFSDVAKTDNHVPTACKPGYDISKDRGSTGPRSNLMAPPHPEKRFNFSKKMPKNSLKNKSFGEHSRGGNVIRPRDGQLEREIGLDLSLNYDPQAQLRATLPNRPPIQDYSRKGDHFFMGESSVINPHRKEVGSGHDVSNRPVLFQEPRPCTQISYGNCSGHQKLDFSDPHKWNNNGVRGYNSEAMRPDNNNHHQRQGKMVSMGRSDEREIVELMAKNQYERSLSESRSNSNSNNFMPHASGFHNMERMTSSHSHQDYDYLHMMRPEKPSMGPTAMRNPGSGYFHHQEQVLDFNMFDGFQQSRNVWMSDSGAHRHHNSRYHHVPKPNKKMTNSHLYAATNLQVLEAFNKYNNNGRHHQSETDVFSSFRHHTSMPHGYPKCSDRDTQKSIMELDLNVVAPNAVEEQNNFEFMTPGKKYHHPKNIHSLDSSYPNEAIPAMQLLSLMDAGKSNHPVNSDERKFSKPLSNCYTHCNPNLSGKSKSSNYQFPNSRYFQSSSTFGVGSSFSGGFQTGGQNVKLTSGQAYYKPQEEKSRGVSAASASYVFPAPCHVNEDRVSVGPRNEPIGTEICTINKNPADFSTPGPENEYMIDVEDLVFRGEKGRSATENMNANGGPKRVKRS